MIKRWIENRKRQQRLLLLWALFLTGLGLRGYAQSQNNAPQDKKPRGGDLENLDQKAPSATALGDIFFKSRNSFVFSLSADETAQDNVLFSEKHNGAFDTSTNISSRIAYRRQYQRTTFGLDYALGSRIYNRYSQYNQLTHDGGLDLRYRLTPRLALALGDRINVAPDASRLFRRDLVLDPLPNDILPNTSLILRLNKSIVNTAYTNLSYQMSRRSQLSLGVYNSMNRFNQASLRELDRYGATISHSYRLAQRTTLNLGYNFNYFNVSSSQSSRAIEGSVTPSNIVRNHFVYVGVTQQLTPSISAFVNTGPNVTIGDSINLGTGFHFRPGVRPSVSAGLLFSQSMALDPRTFFSFNVNQSLSDGFGLGAVTQVQTTNASLGRRLTKKVTAAINAGYIRNKFLTDFDRTGREITTNGILVGSNLRINLTERFSFHANYSRFQQRSSGFSQAIPDNISGNVFAVGLSSSIPVFF